MYSIYTRMKNYKPDYLYEELFRRHLMERYEQINDVILHNVCTHSDNVTHTVSVEIYMDNNEILFRNLKIVTSRNAEILIFLTPDLMERF